MLLTARAGGGGGKWLLPRRARRRQQHAQGPFSTYPTGTPAQVHPAFDVAHGCWLAMMTQPMMETSRTVSLIPTPGTYLLTQTYHLNGAYNVSRLVILC